MHLVFDDQNSTPSAPKTMRNTLPHVAKNSVFQRVAPQVQRVAGNFIAQHIVFRNTLRHTFNSQRVALIVTPTQWVGGRRNTATLLSLKYFYNGKLGKIGKYVCVYGKNIETAFEVWRGLAAPALSVLA
jgi:hypothetical protein